MSELFNYQSGVWEEDSRKLQLVVPSFAIGQKAAIAEMLTAQGDAARREGLNVITNDPMDYLGEEEAKSRKVARSLGEAGLFFYNPGLAFHIGWRDWYDQDRVGFMSEQGLLNPDCDVDMYTDYLNELDFLDLKTGMIILPDTRLQMRGQSYDAMSHAITANDEKIMAATNWRRRVASLSVRASMDYYAQSETNREMMNMGDGLGEYTSDLTPRGLIAVPDAWYKRSHLGLTEFDRHGLDHLGMHAGIVKYLDL
ncbi:hypothetical protein FWF74_01850 [Candidatus Saccharibacteria bacterium]|nr:hypothetical protein [Candidatus Saccharibacteria bacterium]MCL1963074.1 hypothetical protein [Candidatus Saccharibacteria bacterium]